jgi:hypothetical protein
MEMMLMQFVISKVTEGNRNLLGKIYDGNTVDEIILKIKQDFPDLEQVKQKITGSIYGKNENYCIVLKKLK